MPSTAFISYSHSDERSLDRLHKHFAMLKRDGLLATWYDHAILPGDNVASEILSKLEQSDLFLAIVSPDYLASNYCYEKEFQHALSLAASGNLRIVPIILEPCDWLSSPLSEFMALPKDGNPISEWTNANNAYLDVVNGLRRLLAASVPNIPSDRTTGPLETGRSTRSVRVKRDFDPIERAEFADATFSRLRTYFQAAATELSQASEDIRTRFEDISSSSFTCSIVNRARQRGGEAHITVHNSRGRRGFGGDISYVFERHAADNTSNGFIRIDADEYNLFLVAESFMGTNRDGSKLTPDRAAEWLWDQFVQRAGIEYE